MDYPIFSIKEIVEIKEKSLELDDVFKAIEKCDDGTVINRQLKTHIQMFASEYGGEAEQYVQIANKNNELLLVGLYNGASTKITNNLTYNQLEGVDNHIMKNANIQTGEYGFYFDGENSRGFYTPLTEDDMLDILRTNKNGEYLFQSSTIVSDNGAYNTVLRNNNFSKSDEKAYKKLVKEYINDIHKSDWSKRYDEIYSSLQNENPNISIKELDITASKLMKEETGYGTMYDYLKSRGYEDKFRKCNTRLVMSR